MRWLIFLIFCLCSCVASKTITTEVNDKEIIITYDITYPSFDVLRETVNDIAIKSAQSNTTVEVITSYSCISFRIIEKRDVKEQ